MADFLTTLSTFFASILELMGDTVAFMWDNPLLLVAVMLGLSGTIIGIVKRFLPRRG